MSRRRCASRPTEGWKSASACIRTDRGWKLRSRRFAPRFSALSVADIAVVLGDTALTPFSTGTYASRSILWPAAPSRGLPNSRGPARAHRLPIFCNAGTTISNCATAASSARRAIFRSRRSRVPGIARRKSARRCRSGRTGDHAGVQADHRPGQYSLRHSCRGGRGRLRFGHVEILKYVVVEDCGTQVNPLIVEGQIYGGTAQGIGTASLEEMQLRRQRTAFGLDARRLYAPGRRGDAADRASSFEIPSPNTEFGIKGVGEGGGSRRRRRSSMPSTTRSAALASFFRKPH